ncbi:MAG: TM0996/MTH895 family glutaredoxin-like protein [Betaproteobacteria bacterium]|nr:TM0996/MTH895 family glutaredoxin-like protein [Betaproteobacteria bacterium]
MDIKILGTGCPKCQRLEQLTREVAVDLGVDAQFEHVRDMGQIMKYPILSTPALVIEGEVKVAGRMPSKEEIARWLGKS